MIASREEGSMMPVVAAVAFAGLVVLALAVEVGHWGATWRETMFAADSGAQTAAAMIDPEAVYDGRIELEPSRAEEQGVAAALAARPRPGRTATAAATPTRVCVSVTQRFEPVLLAGLGIDGHSIEATACAEPRQG